MCFALSPLQVPDTIRKVPVEDAGKTIAGKQNVKGRRVFRAEAKERGVDVSTTSWSQRSVAEHRIHTIAILFISVILLYGSAD